VRPGLVEAILRRVVEDLVAACPVLCCRTCGPVLVWRVDDPEPPDERTARRQEVADLAAEMWREPRHREAWKDAGLVARLLVAARLSFLRWRIETGRTSEGGDQS
jgi:hypothetical protein